MEWENDNGMQEGKTEDIYSVQRDSCVKACQICHMTKGGEDTTSLMGTESFRTLAARDKS